MNYQYNENSNTWKEQTDLKPEPLWKLWCDPRQRRTLIMLAVITVIVAIFLLSFLSVSRDASSDETSNITTLVLANIIFRHGMRTPSGTYNSDPYKHYDWPGGFGALTNLGKQQLFNLGMTIRKRYRGFLPDDYDDKDVYVKSSDKSRTLMSAYVFLAGLYPPTEKQTWNSKLQWQPIPVHSVPRESDPLIAAKVPCDLYDVHFDMMKNSTELQEFNKIHENLYGNLTVNCNQSMDSPLAVELLYSHLEIQKFHGLTLPNWTEGILDEMRQVAEFNMAIQTFDDTMKRIKGGPLVGEMLDNMKNKVAGNLRPNRKMFIYSAHDLTIVNVWQTLYFRELMLPDFGATLVLELHTIPETTDHEIKLMYYNSSSTIHPYQLDVPHCAKPCTLTQFELLMKKLIPTDLTKECNVGADSN